MKNKLNSNCDCLGCIFSEIQDYPDEPIPNIEKCITELFVFHNVIQNDKLCSPDLSGLEKLLEYVDKFENGLLYNIEDAKCYLDLIRLTTDSFKKENQNTSADSRFLTGRPVISSKYRIKASAMRLKNKKSVLENFQEQHVL